MGTSDNCSDEFAGNLISAFAIAVSDRINQRITDATQLNDSSCFAIVQIANKPGLSIECLSKILQLKHSSVGRLINKLELNEMIHRHKNTADDMRRVSIVLTEKGQELYDCIQNARKEAVQTMLDGFSKADRKIFAKTVGQLLSKVIDEDMPEERYCKACDASFNLSDVTGS